MNSSRGWGDDSEQVSVAADTELRRRMLRGLPVALAVLLVVAGIWVGWRAVRSRCEPLLEQARILISNQSDDPSEWIDQSLAAESLLRDYLHRRGPNEDVAELLLCANLTLRGSYGDPNQSISQPREVEELLNKINPSACPTEDLLTAIQIFIRSGKLAQADWLVGAAVKNSEGTDDYQRVLRLAANLRYDLGREEEVLGHCRQLSVIDPTDPEPWRLTAMVFEDAGYDERMIEALDKVIQLDPGDTAKDRLKLTSSLITVGDRGRARAQFSALEADAPDTISVQPLIKSRLLMLEGETQDASAIIQQVLADDPQDAEAMLLRSQLLLSQSELGEAIQVLERLLEAEPMNFQAHYVLGQACARQGERERAQQHLAMHRRILDARVKIHSLERRAGRNARDTEARTELIRLYDELGMTQHADFWRRSSASGPDGPL